jgi:hypothetical protein
MSTTLRRIGCSALVIGAVLPVAVQAESLSLAPADLAAAALPATELASARGGSSLNLTQLSQVNGNAAVTGNSVVGGATGTNLLSGSAFSGSSGFATVIQNTGNHVIIQDTLILNVSLSQ